MKNKYYEKYVKNNKEKIKKYKDEYRRRNKDKINEYQREYYYDHYELKPIVRYGIYDLEDNYVYEGTLDELCEYLGRNKKSLTSSISHIRHNRNNNIRFRGKKYQIIKSEE